MYCWIFQVGWNSRGHPIQNVLTFTSLCSNPGLSNSAALKHGIINSDIVLCRQRHTASRTDLAGVHVALWRCCYPHIQFQALLYTQHTLVYICPEIQVRFILGNTIKAVIYSKKIGKANAIMTPFKLKENFYNKKWVLNCL